MRLLSALCLSLLSCVAACTLDFDRFETSGAPNKHDGGDGDGGVQPGDECSDEGARECDAQSIRRTLVCRKGVWEAGPSCAAGERCDDSAGATLGRCVPDGVTCDDAGVCTDGGAAGDGGGGGKGSSAPKNKPPKVEIVFPLPGITDRDSITVRGSVSDPEDDKVTKLSINGKAAKLTSDGAFSVSVPLEIGAHPLAMHVEDARGAKADIDGNEIERFVYLFQRASDMAFDSDNKRVIAVDGATDAVVAISLEDGARTLIARPSDGTPFGRSTIELDAANNRALVTEFKAGALAWIDLETGKRTKVSDATNGGAFEPHAVVLDPVVAGRAFVAVAGGADAPDLLYTVDLASGTRTAFPITGITNYGVVSDIAYDTARSQLVIANGSDLFAVAVSNGAGHFIAATNRLPPSGHGAFLIVPHQLAIDGDRAIVLSADPTSLNGVVCISEVNLADGAATELAGLTIGAEPLPESPSELSPFAFDAKSGEALVLDIKGQLLRARLKPGDREYVSTALYGDGAEFERPISIAEDVSRDRWIVADEDAAALIAVDKRTGNRTVLSDADSGGGTAFDTLVAVAVDATNDDVIVLGAQRLYSVDPVSGARTVIASDVVGDVIGSGPAFAGAIDLDISPDGTKAVVAGCYGGYPCASQLIAIALADGTRTVLSADGTGTGPLLQFTSLATAQGAYLVTTKDHTQDEATLLSVDATSGTRTVIADATTGAGPALLQSRAVTYDLPERRAIVINEFATPQKLVAIDLTTGDRTQLTPVNPAAGTVYPTLPASLIVDASTHRLLVAHGAGESDSGLLAVMLADRKRTLISDQSRGTWRATALALDADQGILYGAEPPLDRDDEAQGALIAALDLSTGERTTISDDSDNGGMQRWILPTGLELDRSNDRLLGVEFPLSQLNALLEIRLDDGTQTVLSDSTTGTGEPWKGMFDVAWDVEGQRSLLTCFGLKAIVAVDAAGERTVFSGGAIGAGPAFESPTASALDAAGGRLFVVDTTSIFAVDLETRVRTLFAAAGDGRGPELVAPATLVVDTVQPRLLVLDTGDDTTAPRLIEIALEDGERSVIQALPFSWFTTAAVQPTALAYDDVAQIVYLGPLYALDLTTGESLLIAGHAQ